MKNKFIYLAVLAVLGLTACEPEFDNEVTNGSYSAGEANFASYVAIGNSLTSGYMDGTVSRSNQKYSFPNTLAKQFSLVGGGAFEQPSYEDDVNDTGGFLLNGVQITSTRLVLNIGKKPAPGPEPISKPATMNLTNFQAKAYNNMGVPGAKSFHVLAPGYGNIAGVAIGKANPYFVRHATSPTATILGDAMTKAPTFFTNWIGNMDVLAYATSGGAGVNQLGNLDPTTYGPNDITDPNVFASAYSTIINTLTSGGAKGVVATIPNVTSIPYFTTVPYNPVPLDATTAGALNQGFAQYNGGLQLAKNGGLITADEAARRTIVFKAGAGNAVTIVDESLTDLGALGLPSYRQATKDDLLVLTASSFIGTTVGGNPLQINGVSVPLADQWVLVPSEIAAIATATTNFNNTIKAIAASKGLAVADMNAIMQQLVTGLKTDDGQIYTANYFSVASLSTVLFSLDGIHPNARGYAVVANEVIKVINKHYKAKLPMVVAGNYPGATIVASN